MIGLACFLILIILICCFFYQSIEEGFTVNNYHWTSNENNEWVLSNVNAETNVVDEDIDDYTTTQYKLPVKVYIVENMNVDVVTNEITGGVSSMSQSDAETIMDSANTKFFKNYGIEWVPTYEIVSIEDTDEAKADMNAFSSVTRDTDDVTEKEIFTSLFKYVPPPSTDELSLYFITFLGHKRQGVYVESSSKGSFIYIGRYSNKESVINTGGVLKERQIDDIDGIPSLTFTVVHELAHSLGLEHLNTEEDNVMNGTTSTFAADEDQIRRMRSLAAFYAGRNGEIIELGDPPETKPLIKRAIPYSGQLPMGYYKINEYEMAAIPDHYYIYDEENMALIPRDYEASQDKTYIFRVTEELEKQLNQVDNYNPLEFDSYREIDPSQNPSQLTTDTTYINSIIDQENESLRERADGGSIGDYRASSSYSFYDNNIIATATPLEDTPGMLGGFCEQNKQSSLEIEKKCSTLDKDMCASTNCCVLLGGDTCVAGNENGPSYQDHYRNPMIQNRDYYYYRGKCYGNCKHS